MLNAGKSSIVGIVVVGMSMLSACGSPSPGSQSTPPNSAVAKGSPIKIITIEPTGTQYYADQSAGLKIGIAAVNAAGGVNGHPIQQIACTDNLDVNVEANCLRSAIADQSVLALVGTDTPYGSQIDPMLTIAKMASIGDFLATPADFTCSVCFPVATGNLNILGQAMAAVRLLRAKTVANIHPATPAGESVPPLLNKFLQPLGDKAVGVGIPVTTPNVTPYAAAAGSAKPDALAIGMSGDTADRFVQAYRGQGFNTPVIFSNETIDEDELAAQLAGVSNVYVASDFNHSVPAYQTFLNDKQKYYSSYPYHSEMVLRTYLAVKEFAFAAGKAKELTRTGILAAMNALSSYDADGLISPPIDYTHPQTEGDGQFPRAFQTTIYLSKFEGGKLVPLNGGKPIDAFTGTTAS